MKKIGLLGVAASLLLSVAALAGEKPANNRAKPQNGQAEGAKDKSEARSQVRERMDPAVQQKMLNEQLAALKKERQAVIGELQGIKQLAVKEKATETAAALDKLMARHEQEFQKKMESLQQRLKRLETGQKPEGKDQKAGDKGKGGDKVRSKDTGRKARTKG